MTSTDALAQQRATRAAFFVPGFLVACWAPLVPYAKARAGLDDAALGAVLLCLGLGSLLAMPFAGPLAARRGCRPVMVGAALGMLATLPLLCLVSSAVPLGAVLFVFGASIGTMDCTMNVQAVAVERESGRALMSGFHAYYSVGGLAGAAFVALLLGAGLGAPGATAAAVLIAAAIVFLAAGAWRTERAPSGVATLAVPHGIVVAIGGVCFLTFLAEGSVLDWSGVFLHDVRAVDLRSAGWGFAAFSVAMTLTRLCGDRIVERAGAATAVLGGGLLAAAGLMLALWIPSLTAALAGYAVLGVGCANIVPVMFTLAGRQDAMPERIAIPAVTTLGYLGVLAGPAAIGFVAQAWSLRGAFALIALALAAAGAVGAVLAVRLVRPAP